MLTYCVLGRVYYLIVRSSEQERALAERGRECESAQTLMRLDNRVGEQGSAMSVVIRTGRSFALAEAVLINPS